MAHTDPFLVCEPKSPRARSLGARAPSGRCEFEALEGRSLLDGALPLVTVSIVDGTATEDGHTALFALTRTGSTEFPLAVSFHTGGTGVPGTDFIALGGTVTIPAGRATVRVPVIPIDNLVVDGTRSVRLILDDDPATYRLGALASQRNKGVSILDNDTRPVVSVATPDPSASMDGGTGTFTIRRSGPTDLPLDVSFAIGGSASPDVDYERLPTSVRIEAGRRAAFVTVRMLPTARLQGDETVRLVLKGSEDHLYTLRTDQPTTIRATVVLHDLPTLTLLTTDPLATSFPADTGEFVIFRSGPTDGALRVTCTLRGSAVGGRDYVAIPTTITIPSGAAFARVTIRGLNTPLPSPQMTVVFKVMPSAAYKLDLDTPGSYRGTVTLIDDTV